MSKIIQVKLLTAQFNGPAFTNQMYSLLSAQLNDVNPQSVLTLKSVATEFLFRDGAEN